MKRIATIFLLLSASCIDAFGPENTAVIVNGDSWASKAVANQYIQSRNIPPINVIELPLNSLADFERVSVDDFRKLILIPVLDQIKAHGLADQIDCIAYSSDVPYAVHVSGDVGKQKLPLVITPTASVNGLTFLYQKVLAKDTAYLKLDANKYAQRVIDLPPEVFSKAEEEQIGKAGGLAREQMGRGRRDAGRGRQSASQGLRGVLRPGVLPVAVRQAG